MSEWKEFKIGEIFKLRQGRYVNSDIMSDSSSAEKPYPVFGGNGVRGYVDFYEYKKSQAIVTCRGNGCGLIQFLPPKSTITNSSIAFELKDDSVEMEFLYYWAKNADFSEVTSGSAQPQITIGDISSKEILLPPLPEQKAIAEVLTSLDDKIDLLSQQNKTLEQLAETLFRHHFIDNAQDDWEIVKLGDIADIQNGFAFSSKDFIESGNDNLEVLKMGHIKRGGGLKSDPKRDFVPRSEKLRKWILDKGDIVMAMTDMKDNVVILGVPAMIDCGDKYVLNQRVARICLKPNKKLINNYLLYIQLKDSEFISELQTKANSGVQVNLSTQAIKEADIIVPPLSEQLKVSEIVSNFYLKMEQNFSHIKSLGSVRDQILPKLISGEIRLN